MVTVAAASRHTMSITTGSGFAGAAARTAARPSPFFRCFLFLTPTSVCWHACQALRRRFIEHCSWEKALPKLKDADRLPDASTVRRWSSGLDWFAAGAFFLPSDHHVA